jgi:hypothetical protein
VPFTRSRTLWRVYASVAKNAGVASSKILVTAAEEPFSCINEPIRSAPCMRVLSSVAHYFGGSGGICNMYYGTVGNR